MDLNLISSHKQVHKVASRVKQDKISDISTLVNVKLDRKH